MDDERALPSAAEWDALSKLSPLPAVPPDSTNAYADQPGARILGQKLFFDPGFSGPLKVTSDLGTMGESGKVSCASCHAGAALDDRRSMPRTVSLGADFHTRNAPPLLDSAHYRWTNWGGRFSAQWELPPPVSESGAIMNGNRLAIAHRLFDVYRTEYEAVFAPMDPALGSDPTRFPPQGKPKPAPTEADPNPADGPWEGMAPDDQTLVNRVFVNYGKALAAYLRLLLGGDSAFDRFVAGDLDVLSDAAVLGARLFVGKARCVECHSTAHLSDDAFHNLGVPQVGEHVPATDDGRFKDVPGLLSSPFNSAGAFSDDPASGRLVGLENPMPEDMRAAFRTPTLRNVAQTAPYMHSGQLATLRDVVDFYDRGGDQPVSGARDERMTPLGLSEEEKADLVAFLETLTEEPPAPELLVAP